MKESPSSLRTNRTAVMTAGGIERSVECAMVRDGEGWGRVSKVQWDVRADAIV